MVALEWTAVAAAGPDIPKAMEHLPPATIPVVAGHSVPDATETDVARKPRVRETYGKLPLSFEVNQGQTDRWVNFLSPVAAITFS